MVLVQREEKKGVECAGRADRSVDRDPVAMGEDPPLLKPKPQGWATRGLDTPYWKAFIVRLLAHDEQDQAPALSERSQCYRWRSRPVPA